MKPIATPTTPAEGLQKLKVASSDSQAEQLCPQIPALFGALADLAATRQQLKATKQQLEAMRGQLEAVKQSWALRIGEKIVAPARILKRLVRL